MKKTPILFAALVLAACETTGNPADGGFLSGVAGIAGGGFQERVDSQQSALEQDQAQAAALQAQQRQVAAQSANIAAEINRLRAIHTQLRLDIANQAAQLRASGVVLSSALTVRVNAVVSASPSGNNDTQRLAALQTAIADARALSDDLARLS